MAYSSETEFHSLLARVQDHFERLGVGRAPAVPRAPGVSGLAEYQRAELEGTGAWNPNQLRGSGHAAQVDPFDTAFGVQQAPSQTTRDVVQAIEAMHAELSRQLDDIINKLPPGAVA